jgi:hypothetical protein
MAHATTGNDDYITLRLADGQLWLASSACSK